MKNINFRFSEFQISHHTFSDSNFMYLKIKFRSIFRKKHKFSFFVVTFLFTHCNILILMTKTYRYNIHTIIITSHIVSFVYTSHVYFKTIISLRSLKKQIFLT